MQCGMIGLGRMGANMARRLLRGGHEVVVTNRSPEPAEELTAEGASGVRTVGELVERLEAPRAIWMSLPAGDVTENTLKQLAPLLAGGDVIVESGNSFYQDTIRRAEWLAHTGLDLLDQGTSGGIWGREIGYCLMIGGSREAFGRLEPAFRTLAPPDGYLLTGPSGSGHFVKMVHNGIEYGMLQACGEGFEILHASDFKGPPTASSGSMASASVAGTWAGIGSDSSGSMGAGSMMGQTDMGAMTWQLTQNGSTVTGSMSFSGSGLPGRMPGSFVGTMAGDDMTFTMDMPTSSMMSSGCSSRATGTAHVNRTTMTMTGTYSGSNSCSGAFTTGQVTMTRR